MADRHIHPQLSQRMPQEIINKLDAYAKDFGVSRTKIVNDAALFYVSAKKCIKCGALNNPEGKKCAVCGADLYSMDEIKNAAVSLAERDIYDISCDFSDKLDKFESIGFSRVYRIRFVTNPLTHEIVISVTILLDDGDGMVLGEDVLSTYYLISSEMIRAELEKNTEKVKELNEKRKAVDKEIVKRYFEMQKK